MPQRNKRQLAYLNSCVTNDGKSGRFTSKTVDEDDEEINFDETEVFDTWIETRRESPKTRRC